MEKRGEGERNQGKMACCISIGTTLSYRANNFSTPSASLSLLTGSRTASSLSLNAKPKPQISAGPLHSAFTPSSLSISSASSFSGLLFSLPKFDLFFWDCGFSVQCWLYLKGSWFCDGFWALSWGTLFACFCWLCRVINGFCWSSDAAFLIHSKFKLAREFPCISIDVEDLEIVWFSVIWGLACGFVDSVWIRIRLCEWYDKNFVNQSSYYDG